MKIVITHEPLIGSPEKYTVELPETVDMMLDAVSKWLWNAQSQNWRDAKEPRYRRRSD